LGKLEGAGNVTERVKITGEQKGRKTGADEREYENKESVLGGRERGGGGTEVTENIT